MYLCMVTQIKQSFVGIKKTLKTTLIFMSIESVLFQMKEERDQ